MKRFLIHSLLLVSCVLHATYSAETTPSVELHWQSKQVTLSKSAAQQLCQQALRLVESSNFHSDPGDKYHFFTLSGVQSDYRREVAGRFLVVTFPTPRKIKTHGGEITVSEIVVGFNRKDFASNLFTIDDSGRIVNHSKFAGQICIQIFKGVQQILK